MNLKILLDANAWIDIAQNEQSSREKTIQNHLEELTDYDFIITADLKKEIKEGEPESLIKFIEQLPIPINDLSNFILSQTYPYLVSEVEKHYKKYKNENEHNPIKHFSDADVSMISLPFYKNYTSENFLIISNDYVDYRMQYSSRQLTKPNKMLELLKEKYQRSEGTKLEFKRMHNPSLDSLLNIIEKFVIDNSL